MQKSDGQRGYRYYLTYLLWYSILFALVTAGVFLVYIVNDRSLVWESDAVSQYVPKAAYFGKEMREIFANFLQGNFEIPLYDFALGMGDKVPFHFEPLYWLFILFDVTDIELAFELVLLVRFYLAGLSMSVFVFYFGNSRGAALAGSFAYLYCDYGLYACLRHTQFVVPMIMLPLAILCMEEIYRKKRWYFCTILVWIHLWCGYYFLYMDTLAMGVYFLIRFFANKEGRTFKEFWLRMRTIVCSYLLGVAIGNITLVNSFASYLNSSRAVTETDTVEMQVNLLSYGLTWPLKFFRSFMTAGRGPGNWLRLGFIPLIFVGIVVLFLKKGRKSLKTSVITGTIFCMIPAVGFVFSGFGNINNRWSYIYSFALAAVLAFVWEDILTLTKKQRCIVAVCCLPSLALFFYEIATGGKKARNMAAVLAFVWEDILTLTKKQRCIVAVCCLPSLALFFYEIATGGKKARNITAISAIVMLATLAVIFFIAAAPKLKRRTKSMALVGLTAFSLTAYGYEVYISAIVMLATLAVIFFIAAAPKLKRRTKSMALVGLTAFSLTAYGYEVYSYQTANVASEFRKNGEIYGRITKMPLAAMEDVEDDMFYRAQTNKFHRSVQGAAQILDYNGIVYYTSTISKIMQEYYRQLGVNSWTLVRLLGFDRRAFLDAMASVKYFAVNEGQEQYLPYGYQEVLRTEKEGVPYVVYENAFVLPLGYTYDQVISEEEWQRCDMAMRQEVMMQAAVVEAPQTNGSLSEMETTEVPVNGKIVKPTIVSAENVEIGEDTIITSGEKGEKAVMTLQFDAPENAEIYLYFKGLSYDNTEETDITYQCGENTYTYGLQGLRNTYYTGQTDLLLNMGYYEKKMDTCTITFDRRKELACEEILIYCQPMEQLESYTDALKEDVLENVEILTNKVKGTISLTEDKLLALSIPYAGGWTAYVDGEKTELLRTNLMYMGLPLSAGEHTIELCYKIPGIGVSLLISAAGIVIFISALVIRRKRKNAA